MTICWPTSAPRGGELAKPDLVTPGVAYSTVPRWNTGHEIEQGTSMASPHAADSRRCWSPSCCRRSATLMAAEIKQALMVTARPLQGASLVDEGTGLPRRRPGGTVAQRAAHHRRYRSAGTERRGPAYRGAASEGAVRLGLGSALRADSLRLGCGAAGVLAPLRRSLGLRARERDVHRPDRNRGRALSRVGAQGARRVHRNRERLERGQSRGTGIPSGDHRDGPRADRGGLARGEVWHAGRGRQ